jgi:transposase
MFVKSTRSKNHTYLSIVETYREEDKVKHRTLLQLGRQDVLKEDKTIERLISSLVKYTDKNHEAGLGGIEEVEELSRHRWGAVAVYQKLWGLLGVEEILNSSCRSKKRQFDLSSVVLAIVVGRLVAPSSKLRVYQRQDDYQGLARVELQHLYRALDVLADGKDKIETGLYEQQKTLFSLKVEVVFYDVTTLYFESVRANELKDFGYSKDAKFGEVQVVVGFIVDGEGRPIGFDFFPGNTFEGHTLEAALVKLKQRYAIKRVVVVADRGINSKLNLHKIKEMGFDYVVGSRLRSLPKIQQGEVLDLKTYQKLGESDILYKIINHSNVVKIPSNTKDSKTEKIELEERIICTWSKKRAEKDKKDRLRLVEKAQELINKPNTLKAKRGARKYIESSDSSALALDASWDGLYGIQTSDPNMSVTEILDAYHTLWRIEESFRLLKSTLETRPVFHWTEKRIIGHLVTCFLAFLLERTLEVLLRQNQIEHSPTKIRDALETLQVSVLNINSQKFFLPSKPSKLAKEICKACNIKIPKTASSAPFLF